MAGHRIGVIDADLQSPGLQGMFGIGANFSGPTLNDFLWGRCTIDEAAVPVGPPGISGNGGHLVLVPASTRPMEVRRIGREGYDVHRLDDGVVALSTLHDLDTLIIDAQPGLNEETLVPIALSDAIAIVLRPDLQDHQGSSILIEVARGFGGPLPVLIVNETPATLDAEAVRSRVASAFHCEVAAVLPHSNDMLALAGQSLMVLEHPDHPISRLLKQIAGRLAA